MSCSVCEVSTHKQYYSCYGCDKQLCLECFRGLIESTFNCPDCNALFTPYHAGRCFSSDVSDEIEDKQRDALYNNYREQCAVLEEKGVPSLYKARAYRRYEKALSQFKDVNSFDQDIAKCVRKIQKLIKLPDVDYTSSMDYTKALECDEPSYPFPNAHHVIERTHGFWRRDYLTLMDLVNRYRDSRSTKKTIIDALYKNELMRIYEGCKDAIFVQMLSGTQDTMERDVTVAIDQIRALNSGFGFRKCDDVKALKESLGWS